MPALPAVLFSVENERIAVDDGGVAGRAVAVEIQGTELLVTVALPAVLRLKESQEPR